jgi:hypothetical protein
MILQVATLMPVRTIMNYQVRTPCSAFSQLVDISLFSQIQVSLRSHLQTSCPYFVRRRGLWTVLSGRGGRTHPRHLIPLTHPVYKQISHLDISKLSRTRRPIRRHSSECWHISLTRIKSRTEQAAIAHSNHFRLTFSCPFPYGSHTDRYSEDHLTGTGQTGMGHSTSKDQNLWFQHPFLRRRSYCNRYICRALPLVQHGNLLL